MAIEARLAPVKDSNRTPTKSIDKSEFRQTQEAQKKTRAVAAGFHQDTSEQEATDLLTAAILTAGMTIKF